MNITNDYRRELKSKIIEYAMNEFRQRGIKAVKMDEISRGLHVSKRTVYEIFGDKEELLLAGIRAQDVSRWASSFMRRYSTCLVWWLT